MSGPEVPPPCVGCLDSRRCWVCVGTGYLHPIGRRGLCARCSGTGRCHLCAPPAAEEPAAGPAVPVQRSEVSAAEEAGARR